MNRIFFMVVVGVMLISKEGSAHGRRGHGTVIATDNGSLLYDVVDKKDPEYENFSEESENVLQLDVDEAEDVLNSESENPVNVDEEGDNYDASEVPIDHTGPEEIADDVEEGGRKSFGNKFWKHRRPAQPVIELGEHDGENSHLPNFYTAEEHYKNAFYCAGTNDLSGLIAVLDTLTRMGVEPDFVLEELRTIEGDNLLLHAVKNDAIDTTRYLLSKGSDVSVTDGDGNTPLQVAVAMGKTDIINAISEIQVGTHDVDGNDDVEDEKLEKR
ncbi:MAG: ankyrin repeat domain-containing protein [Aaplasma endosymbiont of Hyalomma asiaticum]